MDCVPEDDVVVRGPQRTIAWARDAGDRRNAKNFLENQKVSIQDKARLLHAFRVLSEQGSIHNKEMFRKERDRIWGFKSNQVRVAAFLIGRVWYLTHGFIKKRSKWPRTELDRADRIRSEHERQLDK